MVREDLMKLDKFQEKRRALLKEMKVSFVSNIVWCLMLLFILLNMFHNEGVSYWLAVPIGIVMLLYNIAPFLCPIQILDLEFCKKRCEKYYDEDSLEKQYWVEDKDGNRYIIKNSRLFNSISCGFTYSFIVHQGVLIDFFDRKFIKKKSDVK